MIKILNDEQVMELIKAAEEVRAAGNYVSLTYNNFSIDMLVMRGELQEHKEWDRMFYFYRHHDKETNLEKYKRCLDYLNKMK